MHPLHNYIANQIADRLKEHRIVVMYDKREELRSFFAEVMNGAAADGVLAPVNIGQRGAKLFVFDGSFLKTRFAVEGATGGDQAEELVIYIPGVERGDGKGSLLMELEKAGTYYPQPALKQFARLALRKRYTDVAIDEMLRSNNLNYTDLARMAADEGPTEGTSILKGVFGSVDTIAILTSWLADSSQDDDLEAKGAVGELRSVALSRLGLTLPDDAAVSRMRAITARYVLANEFRSDVKTPEQLAGPATGALSTVSAPTTVDQQKAIREITKRLRERFAAGYVDLADRIEDDLGLTPNSVAGDSLGAIDTFRFEERAVISSCFDLIAAGRFAEARTLMASREDSFWVNRDVARKTVWQVCGLMTDVGMVATAACATIAKANGTSASWVDRYVSTGADGWFRLDHAQRRLETYLSSVEDQIDERVVAGIRSIYEDAVRRMAEGFSQALEKSGWSIPGVLHQTRIWSDIVADRPRPVAYILVDALRYEIGHELAERITHAREVQMRPAIAALPSITPIGMAALLPGASATFSVVEEGGKFGAMVDGSILPDLTARQKYFKSRIPELVDITLDDVISGTTKTLQKKIGSAKVIIVRSTEIDGAGENATTTSYARRIMDGVVEDIARCLQRLAALGIEDAVVTADHGHLFFADDRNPSMRIDAPTGVKVDLHRRCWVGRGGNTPAASIRVPGAKLGYATDLDFVFPASTSVFKSGGDLAYHHGGVSLQEMVIPVITVKLKADASVKAERNAVTVTCDFDAVTNRIFTVQIELGGRSKSLFENVRTVRPLVIFEERQVARAAIATGATLEDGRLTLSPGGKATVGFMLTDDTVKQVRIQVLDAETDVVLYVSPKDIPVRLGV